MYRVKFLGHDIYKSILSLEVFSRSEWRSTYSEYEYQTIVSDGRSKK